MGNKNYKEIKTFSDACRINGFTEEEFNNKFNGILSSYLLAVAKLEIIVKAINGDWIPDWKNSNQYKYYPWFNMGDNSGVGFSFGDYGCVVLDSRVGSRLSFFSSDAAIYAGNQFEDIYKQMYCFNTNVNEVSLKDYYTSPSLENKEDNIIDLKCSTPEPLKDFDYKTIKTYGDACNKLGLPLTEPTILGCLPEFKKANIALYKLMVIFKAINNGWTPDWTNTSQNKYYPYFKMGDNSGVGFSYSDYSYDISYSSVGSRLCCEKSDIAIYVAQHFGDLYKDAFLLLPEEIYGYITVVTTSDMKEIYNIACTDWKKKIIDLTKEHTKNPFEDKVYLPNKIVDEMIKACTAVQLPVVKRIMKR